MNVDAVLLLAFGGPSSPEEVAPFLARVAEGKGIPAARLRDVAHHYEVVGGRSPIVEHTRAQATALAAALAAGGTPAPVSVGMRHSAPFIADALRDLTEQRARRVLAIVLAAHASEASSDPYRAAVQDALRRLGPSAPEVEFAGPWHLSDGFIAASASCVTRALAEVPEGARRAAQVIFTAHSIPACERSNYAEQVAASAAAVAERIGHARYRIAYQSRSGPPHQPWLVPDICAALREEAAAGTTDVVVAPIGFVSDHVEVLYDLDYEAGQVARGAAIAMHRACTVGTHPAFIAALANVVREHAAAGAQHEKEAKAL